MTFKIFTSGSKDTEVWSKIGPFVTPRLPQLGHGFSTGLLNTSLPIVIRGTLILTYKTTLLFTRQIPLYE